MLRVATLGGYKRLLSMFVVLTIAIGGFILISGAASPTPAPAAMAADNELWQDDDFWQNDGFWTKMRKFMKSLWRTTPQPQPQPKPVSPDHPGSPPPVVGPTAPPHHCSYTGCVPIGGPDVNRPQP